ncbi:DNA polymerase delta catalytic subunit [Durusdinium trenchii]|uniref:DNA polymerase n=1 Tax=Durusdinium trenchii TaxID=1381693 RepID=A0ABP0LQJ8_9DINO
MQVDIDYYTKAPDMRFPNLENPYSPETVVPVLRMYGVTEEGHSLMAHIHGFEPYFYVECPEELQKPDGLEAFRQSLESLLATSGCRDKASPFVRKVELVQRSTLMRWQGSNEHSCFLRVVVAVPSLVATCRRMLEAGFSLGGKGHFPPSTSYETNIPFALRFMVDRELAGGGWVLAENAIRRAGADHLSWCQLEVDMYYSDLKPQEKLHIAPLRILSFDIECYNPEGKGFPKAESSPVIQIAVYLKVHGCERALSHAVWTLNSCNEIAGATVYAFETEEEMLMSFRHFVQETDPDVITGYNIVNFDLPYLVDRSEVKNINTDFCKLGRLRNDRCRKRVNNFSGRESIEINIDGRINFDMLAVIQKEQKLSSYSLNAVSAEFLGEQKEDVHHSMIGDLFLGSAESRRRLAIYCLKDAYLPMRLMEKLLCMYNYVEMARVTGTPINFLLNRGQMIKVQSQLLRKAQQCGFVMPTLKTEASNDKFEGATVLDPLTGYYPQPIATLDFASLYPSIMMAHNLCYCTLLKPEQVRDLQPDEYTKTPSGCFFLKSSKRRGLLPMILEELLAARKRAKKAMAEATDPLTKSVLNGRQLALKVSANSVYGFTGATVGVLPCLDISSSVTAFGRTMIDHTKQMVEANYCIEKGYPHDAQVIYGDTDSVMVKFGVDDVAEAMRLGQEAAAAWLFGRRIVPESLFPYGGAPQQGVQLRKWRYAGLYWTNPHNYDKLDAKGIETVRRDNCGLVRQLVDISLRTILIDKSVPKAVEFVQKAVSDLLQNKIDLSLLVITKSLGRGAHAEDYAAKQAHVELAERMRKRDPSTAPGSGDRVPYVIVTGSKGAKAYERSEDPLYALENNKSVDAQYYIEHQLQLPLLRIFGPIMGDDKKAQSLLFCGQHTRKLHTPTPQGGALAKFVTKSLRCMGCKAVIKAGLLCEHCEKEKAADVVIEQMENFRQKEEEFSRLWTQCQRCQGSLLEPVICSNRDCEIFYRRAKAGLQIKLVWDDECVNSDSCAISALQLQKSVAQEFDNSSETWGSCARYGCGASYSRYRSCQCNSKCHGYRNCCSDYDARCRAAPAPAPTSAAACSAIPSCRGLHGDCCPTANGMYLGCCPEKMIPHATAPPATSEHGRQVMTLYHQTSPEACRSIIRTGFNIGHSGWCGGAIYFALSPQATKTKAITPHSGIGCMLEVKVDVGRMKKFPCCRYCGGRQDEHIPWTYQKLKASGHDSIEINPGDGPEVVIYDKNQVLSIKEIHFDPAWTPHRMHW